MSAGVGPTWAAESYTGFTIGNANLFSVIVNVRGLSVFPSFHDMNSPPLPGATVSVAVWPYVKTWPSDAPVTDPMSGWRMFL